MEIPIPSVPLVSIILPIRNAAQTLFPCLQSLLFQNYQEIEILAVDDCSRDNSLQILREFQKIDSRLKVIKNIKSYGRAISINRALKKAKGSFIIFMEQTDMVTPLKITKQIQRFREDRHIVAVNSQCNTVNDTGKRTGKSAYPELASSALPLPYRHLVLFSGMMINRYRVPKDLLLCTDDDATMHAAHLIGKLLSYGHIVTLPEFLHTHMAHQASEPIWERLSKNIQLWAQAKANNHPSPSLTAVFSTLLQPSL